MSLHQAHMSKPFHSACRLSQRWHQQFCHSAKVGGHQRCLQALQPSRQYRQVARERRPRQPAFTVTPSETEFLDAMSTPTKSDIVVREFEQDVQNKKILKRVDPTSEITHEMAEVKAQLEKLEEELAVMKQGPFGPQSEFMKSLPSAEREQLLKALAEEGAVLGDEEDMLTMAELDRIAEEDEQDGKSSGSRVGVTLRIPKKNQAYVRHFNKALRAAQEAENDTQKNLALWTWYLRCQQQIHNFSTLISNGVWKTLWETQTMFKTRPKHLVMLAQDMLNAGKELLPGQWLTYVESLHVTGDTAAALEVWGEQKKLLGSHAEHSNAFWSIGIKAYAAAGNPSRAQELALNAIAENKAQPFLLIPIIIAWAKSGGTEALVKSWACYLKLRERLGTSITSSNFEDISNAFLDADCADMALMVFKDMLLSRGSSSHDSQNVYRQATKHFEDVLQNANTEEHINHIGLSALLILPRQFQNRFFFTSWIKKLIGQGRIDSAAMVVELMYERGINPDARPLNGIIGAWLRDGSPAAQKKAQDLAWAMIDAKSEAVRSRSAPVLTGSYRKVILDDNSESVKRRVPSATIETFSILLLHHTRRSDFEAAEELTRTLTESCQMRPNAFILNHWLYAELRKSNIQEVWNKYQRLKNEISPDLATFAALWDTAKVQYSHTQVAFAKDFPTARQLFAEMVAWSCSITDHKMKQTKLDFSPELYEQIIRCFSLSTDLPGTLSAMHGLNEVFGLLPDDNSIRLICGQAARSIPQENQGRVRSGDARARRSSSGRKNILTQVVDIVDTIEAKKKIDMVEQGADARALQDPASEIARNLRLDVMTEFICMFLQKKQSATGSYRNDVKIAARSMGVNVDGIDLEVSTD